MLLTAVLRIDAAMLEGGTPGGVTTALAGLASLQDPRVVPILLAFAQGSGPARLGALEALASFVGDPRALQRLLIAVGPDAPADDALAALPGLLRAALLAGAPTPIACPEGFACASDSTVLELMLTYAAGQGVNEQLPTVKTLAELGDVRLLPFLLRQSQRSQQPVRDVALCGLARLATAPAARERLLLAVASGGLDATAALDGVFSLADDDAEATATLLAARVRATDPDLKRALEAGLNRRAPAALKQLLVDEAARLAAEAAAPGQFDAYPRWGLTAGAAVAGGVGGYAASAVAADAISNGSGGCYGLWGGCTGAASAGAITWFALADRQLELPQLGLALSAAAVGGFTGMLVPVAVGPGATQDSRHAIYSASGGALVGLAVGTVAALSTHNSGEDVGEYLFTVAAVDALTTGALLTLSPPGGQVAFLSRAVIASTLIGSALGGVAAWQLDLKADEQLHMALLGGVGLASGLFAGGAVVANSLGGAAQQVPGIGLLGGAAGLVVGGTLGAFDLKPTGSGMVYEVWASTTGAFIGAGLGGLIGTAANSTPLVFALSGTSLGIAAGAASTVLAPDGVSLDVGDLALQPLFVLFALWHGGALAYSVDVGADYGTPMMLLTPALTSAGLVAAAPWINASGGDVLMTASMMGTGAWLSAMTLLSIQERTPVQPVAWVLGTSLAMDAGIGAAVLLSKSGIPQVGWRTTYVLGVTAGTTLVLALPGSLLAQAGNGSVAVSDVLVGSSLLGVAIGLLTQGLIDFRVAPDLGLSDVIPLAKPDAFSMQPMIAPLPPVPALTAQTGRSELPIVFGASGTF